MFYAIISYLKNATYKDFALDIIRKYVNDFNKWVEIVVPEWVGINKQPYAASNKKILF